MFFVQLYDSQFVGAPKELPFSSTIILEKLIMNIIEIIIRIFYLVRYDRYGIYVGVM